MANFSKFIKSSRLLNRLFFGIGIVLFAYLVYRLKPSEILACLSRIGPNFIFILLTNLAWFIFYTLAWEVFLKTLSTRVSFWKIFKIKLSGEAINSVTPLSWWGGDPARILIIKNHIPVNEGTASVVVDRILHNLALALFMVIGIVLALLEFELPLPLEIGLLVTLAFIVGASIFLFLRSHEGLFEFVLDLGKKLRIKKHYSEKTLRNVTEIDQNIARFYKKNRMGFFASFFFHFMGRVAGVVEIFLAAYFLGQELSWIQTYLLASITVIVNLIFVFVPSALGIMEGAYAGIFVLLHLDPVVGTSIQIIRRARMVFWTGLGFAFMALNPRTRHHPMANLEPSPSSE